MTLVRDLIDLGRRYPSAAAGLAIGLWLVGIVLWDLALLGALVADEGGGFSTTVFPWLLVTNPADAFRLVNLSGSDADLVASGFVATPDGVPALAPALALLVWPPVALAIAWSLFRRIEP